MNKKDGAERYPPHPSQVSSESVRNKYTLPFSILTLIGSPFDFTATANADRHDDELQ